MDKKIVILIVVLLFVSSIVGVVAWGASTNWWSPEESPQQAPSPAVTPQQAPSPAVTLQQAPSPAVTPQAPSPAVTPQAPRGQSSAPAAPSIQNRYFRLKSFNSPVFGQFYLQMAVDGSKVESSLRNNSAYQLWSYDSDGYIKNKGTNSFWLVSGNKVNEDSLKTLDFMASIEFV